MQIQGYFRVVRKNGSGKTTTIGVLLGLIKANRPSIHVGLDCWKNSFEIRQKLSVMHESNDDAGMFSARRFLTHVA